MSGEQGGRDTGRRPGARPSPGAVRPLVDGVATPRLSALDGLLRDLDALRRTLETDLTLAAAAVDADEPELAGALVQSDRDALAAFEARALVHLRSLERADAEVLTEAPAEVPAAAPAPQPAPSALPVVPRRRRRALRVARLLPAAPLVAAAAALVGLLGIPQTATRPAPPQVPGAVLSSWEELTRLSAQDAPPDDVGQAAMDLNADLATMVARSGDDPAAARQALALLREAQAVLSADDDAPALAAALASARQLAARLLASLPAAARPPAEVAPPAVLATALPSPRQEQRARSPRAPRSSEQAGPRTAPAPARPQRQAPDRSSGSASDTSAEGSATPRPTSSTSRQPTPSASPSRPSASPTPPPVLPGPVTDPLQP